MSRSPAECLPAGKYVFRLADTAASRHVVQVFDQTGGILATVLTIPAARLTAADETPVTSSLEFRSLPGGDYDVRAILIDSAGHQRAAAREHVIVLPSGGDRYER
jgi:hypothetical protein